MYILSPRNNNSSFR